MVKLLLGLVAVLLLVAACETTAASRASADPALPPQERGRFIYESSCNRCHALYMPMSFRAEEWPFYVRKYGRKARLSAEERDLVMAYLEAHARP
jgi:cytochrome c5